MRSVIRTNPFARAAAAFLVGGLAVLVVHQPVVGLLHALGFTPVTPYSLRATQPWGIPVFLSLSFWGGVWTIPIAWILDRVPHGWVYWAAAVGVGALAPTLTTWFVIFPLKGISSSGACIGRPRQCANRQWHLGPRICVRMVSEICYFSDGRALTNPYGTEGSVTCAVPWTVIAATPNE